MIEVSKDASIRYRQRPENRSVIEQLQSGAGARWKYHSEYASAKEAGTALVQITREAEPETALTTVEQTDLARYEHIIERGLDTFVAVGNALLAIRRERLYRATHSTFEAYCEARWQITSNYANKLVSAAEVVGNLVPMGTMVPKNERQARPLTKLEPIQQREAWQKAVDAAPPGKAPTAAQVKKAVAVAKRELEPDTDTTIEAEYKIMPKNEFIFPAHPIRADQIQPVISRALGRKLQDATLHRIFKTLLTPAEADELLIALTRALEE